MIDFKLLIIGFLGLISFYFLYKEFQEILFLKRKLKEIIGKSRIEVIEDLVKIKNYLQSNITYNANLKNQTRPILRHTATQILKSNYGFCGENARAAIKLFMIGGARARRVYLFRKEWQHVLIEHKFKGKWYMFDGHYDPSSLLTDEAVSTILSEEISLYPNDYKTNPYLDYCRVKLFYKIGFFKPFAKIKLPQMLIYIAESPFLIKGCFTGLLLIITLTIIL